MWENGRSGFHHVANGGAGRDAGGDHVPCAEEPDGETADEYHPLKARAVLGRRRGRSGEWGVGTWRNDE